MKLLDEREKTHGNYAIQAETAQGIKGEMTGTPNWNEMPAYMRESLDLIATKLSRACHGNPNEIDHWKDIAGYAQLVVRELEKK